VGHSAQADQDHSRSGELDPEPRLARALPIQHYDVLPRIAVRGKSGLEGLKPKASVLPRLVLACHAGRSSRSRRFPMLTTSSGE
jgi:hypothetical protein